MRLIINSLAVNFLLSTNKRLTMHDVYMAITEHLQDKGVIAKGEAPEIIVADNEEEVKWYDSLDLTEKKLAALSQAVGGKVCSISYDSAHRKCDIEIDRNNCFHQVRIPADVVEKLLRKD